MNVGSGKRINLTYVGIFYTGVKEANQHFQFEQSNLVLLELLIAGGLILLII